MCCDPLPVLAADPLRQAGFRWQKARRERLTVEAHMDAEGVQLQVDDLIEAERQAAMKLVDLLIEDLGFCYWIGGRDAWHPDDRVTLAEPIDLPSVAEACTAIDVDTD